MSVSPKGMSGMVNALQGIACMCSDSLFRGKLLKLAEEAEEEFGTPGNLTGLEWKMIRHGMQIETIKKYRARTNAGLKVAKDFVDSQSAKLGLIARFFYIVERYYCVKLKLKEGDLDPMYDGYDVEEFIGALEWHLQNVPEFRRFERPEPGALADALENTDDIESSFREFLMESGATMTEFQSWKASKTS